jgi:hypothetical protein
VAITPGGILNLNYSDPFFNQFIKTNNAGAYNAYSWPNTAGTARQQLTTDGAGVLTWEDADYIPWTAKGQLIVGTGANTDTILSVGTNGQILIADSTAASGLAYTSNYVATTSATGVANIPAGTTGQQPATPNTGAFRYNTDTTSLEFWNGGGWETVASSSSNSFVEKTSDNGAAIIPAGLQTQRPGAPSAGFFRFNDDTDKLEFWDGNSWDTVASSTSGTFVELSVATTGTNSAIIPGGTTAQRQSAPVPAEGYLRYNSTEKQMEYYDGTGWTLIAASATGEFVSKTVPTAPGGATANAVIPAGTTAQRQTTPAPAVGEARFNTTTNKLEVYGSAGWESVATGTFVSQTVPTLPAGATANAVIPAGTTAQRQTAPALGVADAGQFRYNTTLLGMEYWDGAAWVSLANISSTSTFGLGLNVTGQTVKLSVTATATPPTAGAGLTQAVDGSIYWDNEYGSFFVRYNDGDSVQWVQATGSNTDGGQLLFPNAPIGGTTYAAPNGLTYTYDGTKGVWTAGSGGGALVAATLSEAAAGTLTTVYSSPQTAVPKNASGMTGAAILPGGTTAQQPAGAIDGWFRHNSTLGVLEYYTNSAWLPVTFSGGTTGGINTNTAAAAPATRSNGLASVEGDLYWNTATNQYFAWDGTAWIPFDQRRPVVTAVNYTAAPNDYVVVTASGRTITLPATPIVGTVVTVVVAGTWLDTVVARNGSNIMALAQDITLDKQYAAMQFTYTDSTNGWRLN